MCLTTAHHLGMAIQIIKCTVLLDLNFTYAHAQKATGCNIHGNAPE